MTVNEEIAELEKKLTLLKDAETTIITGGVRKFGKGDTHYTMLSLDEISKYIKETQNKIHILKGANNVCL